MCISDDCPFLRSASPPRALTTHWCSYLRANNRDSRTNKYFAGGNTGVTSAAYEQILTILPLKKELNVTSFLM